MSSKKPNLEELRRICHENSSKEQKKWKVNIDVTFHGTNLLARFISTIHIIVSGL